jgi:hypothetical protein
MCAVLTCWSLTAERVQGFSFARHFVYVYLRPTAGSSSMYLVPRSQLSTLDLCLSAFTEIRSVLAFAAGKAHGGMFSQQVPRVRMIGHI